ncbi:MAG: aminoglycoside phosphotransferase [Rhodobacteraceae bacterium]|nr:MAG: aminoglycoside phosphotransferase [Paracoccaceae bacterium]
MGALYDDDFLDALRRGAAAVAPQWGLSPRTEVTLLTISENATFRADDPERPEPVILRVHRPNYHTREEIDSELDWIEALRAERIVEAPEPLRTTDGARLAEFAHDGEPRHVAAFAFLPGAEPEPDGRLAAGFATLGEISARLHGHARRWAAPAGFARKVWDFETTIGARPHWGSWRDGLGLTAEGRATLARCAAAIGARVAAYGAGPDRFGLVHADLRLANLLDDGERLAVIDFDDCGFGWFGYDFAAAVSFLEEEPFIPDLAAAWVEGYRRVAPLSAEDEAMLPAFVMLRRLMLTAWIATHAETPTAREAGLGAYTDGTLRLADKFLSQG